LSLEGSRTCTRPRCTTRPPGPACRPRRCRSATRAAAWLAGIIVNLLTVPGFYDVALRDFGLLLGALTLTRLALSNDR
jgi:hypothetical protein